MIWLDDRSGNNDVYFRSSTNGGATWQTSDVRLDTATTAGAFNSDEAKICCDGARVYVVWQDDRNGDWDIFFTTNTP